MKKVCEILSQNRHLIKQNNNLQLRVFLESILNKDLSGEFVQDIYLSEDEENKLLSYLARFMADEPPGKIVNKTNFYGYNFFVDENVLDPRCDTEAMIDAILNKYDTSKPISILDLGTGSGCLGLTLLKKFPNATALAIDISPKALEIAHKNAIENDVRSRVTFLLSNWLDDVPKGLKFDLVVSNPPYIRTGEISGLERSVMAFDPIEALDGGEDGLVHYRAIFSQINPFLKDGAHIFIEIGDKQIYDVKSIAKSHGFTCISDICDMAGNVRVLELCSAV